MHISNEHTFNWINTWALRYYRSIRPFLDVFAIIRGMSLFSVNKVGEEGGPFVQGYNLFLYSCEFCFSSPLVSRFICGKGFNS